MMIRQLIPVTALAALMLGGCGDTSNDTARDIRETRDDAAQNINAARDNAQDTINRVDRDVNELERDLARTNANAREQLNEAEADARTETAQAVFEVEEAEANGRHNIAMERCDAVTGVEKDACISTADANLASELAIAVSRRDNALVAAERNR